MSSTILGGDVTVYYEAENRQKRLEWTGSATGTQTMNAVYSGLQDLFDDLGQMDDGTPMSAQTPTAYTVGIIDTGDDDPWFIDDTTVEHFTGGAITTASWARVVGTNTGIVKMDYTETVGLIASDIGKTIVMTTDGDSGTVLDYRDDGGTGVLWIRPDTSAAGNSFDDTTPDGAWTVTGGTGTGTQLNGTAVTGESLWSNIFTIGTIAANTHIYVEQNNVLLTANKDTTDWWVDGAIDILIKVKEADVEIDEAVITVFARQLTKTYSFFESDLTTGGATAIPLGSGTDLNAGEGVREMVITTGATSEPTVGEVITDDSDATISGVITSVVGTNPNVTLQYYLIGDPLNDFTGATGALTGASSGFTATAVAPTSVNSGVLAGVTFTYTNNSTIDVDENDTVEDYSIVINASDELLLDVYQYAQYLTRRGNAVTTDTDGQQGQFYRGIDTVLTYSGAITGTITEGNTVTQETSGATGTIVASDEVNKLIMLRDSRGTFSTNATTHTLTDDIASGTVEINTSAEPVTPNAAAPFGTFAGGIWFLARGVVVDPTTIPAADAQNIRSFTNDGTTVTPPNKVTVEITNLRLDDRATIHRLTAVGGVVEKNTYFGTAQTIGDPTLIIGTGGPIATDEPGKTSGGTVVLTDVTADTEYALRYTSWTASTFTLANIDVASADAGTNTTNITEAGAFTAAAVKVGDLVLNKTRSNAVAYVTARVDDNNITISPAITGQTTADAIEINAIPVTTTTSDEVYVPILYRYEGVGTDGASGSESTTLTYSADIPALVRVRNATNTASTTTPMLPYAAEVTVGANGLSNAAIRTKDSIHA